MIENAAIAGFDAEKLAKLSPAMRRYIENGYVAGFVTLVWRHGVIVQHDAQGWRDEEAAQPMRRDTIFRIASMTKPVTALAALMLVEEGRLHLDQPIESFLPEFSDMKVLVNPVGSLEDVIDVPRSITLRDLLTHRSGLSYSFNAPPRLASQIIAAGLVDMPSSLSLAEWAAALGRLPLISGPGGKWHYGPSFGVIGLLIERVSGTSFPTFLKKRVFDPLGMSDTAFNVEAGKLDRVSALYTSDGSIEAKRIRVEAKGDLTQMPSFPYGGGGLVSTADDYLRFAHLLLKKGAVNGSQLVRPETVDLMLTNQLSAEQRGTSVAFLGGDVWRTEGFGLGVAIYDRPGLQSVLTCPLASPGKFAWDGMHGTQWFADPKRDLTALLMIQRTGAAGPGHPMRYDFQRTIYEALSDDR